MDEALVNGWKYENDAEYFPMKTVPETSWGDEQRKFGYQRDKGARLHAGCDLYDAAGVKGVDPDEMRGNFAHAVKKGRIVRYSPTFTGNGYGYHKSQAIEIHHGKFTARYCEIDWDTRSAGVDVNKMVEAGQPLAKVKNVLQSRIQPMLHFELYKNTVSVKDSLSTSADGKINGLYYGRRKDLKNPTAYLDKLKSSLPPIYTTILTQKPVASMLGGDANVTKTIDANSTALELSDANATKIK
jgi:hypothetical protein